MLCSPIKPLLVTTDINETENKTDIDDIPSQFTKVLGKGKLLHLMYYCYYA